MTDDDARDRRWRRAFHPPLLLLTAGCFVGALVTDITYARTADMIWTNFSAWLLAAGLVLGGIAWIACLVDLLGRRRVRTAPRGWAYVVAFTLILVVALFDNFIHTRDAWTSVVPTGLTLSAILAIAIVLLGVLGALLVYPERVAAEVRS